jgi:hypothetical protein
MGHSGSNIQELPRRCDEPPVSNHAPREVRDWLLSQLSWERRLAELRAVHERDRRSTTASAGSLSA